MKAKNSTEVLKAGKWILENVGWVQGTSFKKNNEGKYVGFCSSGVLNMVEISHFKHYTDAYTRLSRAMGGSVVVFNDDKSTTKEKVLKAFDRAIKKEIK